MLTLIIIGSIVGTLLGLTGAGGGSLAVPLLIILGGFVTSDAISLSLVMVGGISIVGIIAASRLHNLRWKRAFPVALSAFLGAPLGSWLNYFFSEIVLTYGFIILALSTVILMLRKGCTKTIEEECQTCHQPIIKVIPLGFISGILAGLFGVGGGFIIVPALIGIGKDPMREASAVSLLAIAIAAVSALSTRILSGTEIHWHAALPLSVAGIIGLLLGQQLAQHIRPCRLKEIFAYSLGPIALLMLF